MLASEEARALKHNYIGTEHLLLGLMREEEGIAARVLESLEITIEEVRAKVARIVGQGDELSSGQIPFTPRAKLILDLSLRQALTLGHNYIGTEHLLLGLVRENSGVASRILEEFDANGERVWNAVFLEIGVSTPPKWVPLERAASLGDGPDLWAVSQSEAGGRWEWAYELWPAMIAGAGIFAGGILAGWLIWG